MRMATRTLTLMLLGGLLAAPPAPAGAQGREEIAFGSWDVTIQPGSFTGPVLQRTYPVCQAALRNASDGWTLVLHRNQRELGMTVRHPRQRPTSKPNDVINAAVGGQRVRLQVERPLMNLEGPGGGLAITIVDEDAFRRGMASGGQMSMPMPGGSLRWRVTGGGDALAALGRCPL